MPASLSRLFIAIAMIAFGIQHLVYSAFVTRVIPPISIPITPYLADLAGAVLILAGAMIIFNIQARRASTILGFLILLSAIFLWLPRLIAAPNAGLATMTGKAFMLSGAALLVAASLRRPARPFFLDKLVPFAPYFLAGFLILGGVEHFMYGKFVGTLVPAWIPGHLAWTYFAGAALVAGGFGIVMPITKRLAANLVGVMVGLWVILLHIPRALAAPHDSNETTAVFEALAVTGAAFLIATKLDESKS
jgi:uncharacterized membrane protein